METAATLGITLIGPNCMGLLSLHSQLHAVGFLELRPPAGRLSIVTQSGNIGVQLVTRAERRGIGIDKYVSVGNQAATSAIDVLDGLADDPQTAAALVYLEGIDDGRHFFDVAQPLHTEEALVVLRAGLTRWAVVRPRRTRSDGQAPPRSSWPRPARRVPGAYRLRSLDVAMCLHRAPLPKGRRVAVHDARRRVGRGWRRRGARAGLELAPLTPAVLAELDALLPGYWSRNNPIDLVAAIGSDLAQRTLTVLVESEAVDAVAVLGILNSPSTGAITDEAPLVDGPGGPCRGRFNAEEVSFLTRVTELMERTGKPIINVRPLRTRPPRWRSS